MIRFFARHPTAANLLMIGIAAAGLLSIKGLRRETFPDFRTEEVEIRVIYPGATAEDVEEAVCQRVEDALDGVRYVEEVRSDAREGLGIITVELKEGGDYRAFREEIDSALAGIDDFPELVEDPIVTHLNTTDPVLAVMVSGAMRPADLKLYAEGLKDRLQELPEVSLVKVQGFSDHQLRVELQAEALVRFNLSPADVAGVIARQSVDVPVGTIETKAEEVLVRFTEERASADALGDLVVLAGTDGAEVRLRDLGTGGGRLRVRGAEGDAEWASSRAIAGGEDADRGLDAGGGGGEGISWRKERAESPAVELLVTNDMSTLVADRLQAPADQWLAGDAAGVRGVVAVFQREAVVLGGGELAGVVSGRVFLSAASGRDDQHDVDGGAFAGRGHLDGRWDRDRGKHCRALGAGRAADEGGGRGCSGSGGRRAVVVLDDGVRAGSAGVSLRQDRAGAGGGADRAVAGVVGEPGRGVSDLAFAPGSFAAWGEAGGTGTTGDRPRSGMGARAACWGQ